MIVFSRRWHCKNLCVSCHDLYSYTNSISVVSGPPSSRSSRCYRDWATCSLDNGKVQRPKVKLILYQHSFLTPPKTVHLEVFSHNLWLPVSPWLHIHWHPQSLMAAARILSPYRSPWARTHLTYPVNLSPDTVSYSAQPNDVRTHASASSPTMCQT